MAERESAATLQRIGPIRAARAEAAWLRGDSLSRSVRTVDHHVAAGFTKLSDSTRPEAVQRR